MKYFGILDLKVAETTLFFIFFEVFIVSFCTFFDKAETVWISSVFLNCGNRLMWFPVSQTRITSICPLSKVHFFFPCGWALSKHANNYYFNVTWNFSFFQSLLEPLMLLSSLTIKCCSWETVSNIAHELGCISNHMIVITAPMLVTHFNPKIKI